MRWDGESWTLMESGIEYALRGLGGSSGDDVWTGCWDCPRTLLLHWDGESWNEYPLRGMDSWIEIEAIVSFGPDDVYAAGRDGWTFGGIILHWDGEEWSRAYEGPPSRITALWGSGPQDIYAVGGQAIVHWDGEEWRQMDTSALVRTGRYSVWGTESGRVYAGGSFGVLAEWDGVEWKELRSFTSSDILGIYSADPEELYLVGGGSLLVKYRVPLPSPTPTATASATPSPTASVTPSATATATPGLGVVLELATDRVRPGVEFWVRGELWNPGPQALVGVPVVFLLDVLGQLYFWPSWSHYDAASGEGLDFGLVSVPVGRKEVEVVSPFVWPDTGDARLEGLRFYGAMLTSDWKDIRGSWAMAEWGYGPAGE